MYRNGTKYEQRNDKIQGDIYIFTYYAQITNIYMKKIVYIKKLI